MYITLIQRNTYCNPVNIFYEDPSAFPKEYQRRIKIQHNYKYVPDMSNCIEMSVENNPKILTNNTHEISNEDIEKLKKWVKFYRKQLLNWIGTGDPLPLYEYLADMDLLRKLKKVFGEDVFEYRLHCDTGFMMTTLYKKETGLPVDIRFDDSMEYEYVALYQKRKYIPRIKFKTNNSNDGAMTLFGTMSIEDEPRILNPDFDCELTENELQQIKDWIRLHKKMLLKVTYGKKYNHDFIEYLERKTKPIL